MNEEQVGALWLKASTSLARAVAELTAKVGDGTPFFDALDERMRDTMYFQALVTRAVALYPEANQIVVSGKFGEAFAPWLLFSEWNAKFPPALLVPGNLRHGNMQPLLAKRGFRRQEAGPFVNDQWAGPTLRATHKYVFLDDSAYKFRTHDKIKAAIEQAQGEVIGHIVLYDGSREAQRVPSFYRWHPAEGMSDEA